MTQLKLPAHNHPVRARIAAATLALAVCALYSLYSWYQWRHYVIPSWDLGIFAQLAKAYAEGRVPIVPIKGEGFNLLGDHFHPITLVLAPFYWLWPSPATLLYVQNGLVALSVYLFTRFAQKIVRTWAALALGLAYALSFGIQQAVSVQFHEVAFALPFLVMSLGNLALMRFDPDRSRLLRRAAYWAFPLVFVKEDMGITVVVIGLVIIWRSGWFKTAAGIMFPLATAAPSTRAQRSKTLMRSWMNTPAVAESSLLTLWGVIWPLLAIGLILPYFNTGGVFDYSDKLDVAAALGDPLGAFAQLFYPWQKSATLGLLLLTGVLAWVMSPLAWVAAPTLIWRFLSPQEGYWEPTWHYNLVLMPIIFTALLDTLARAQARNRVPAHPLGSGPLASTRRALLTGMKYRAPEFLPALALLIALGTLPYQPLAQLKQPAFATSTLSATDEMKAEAVSAIPTGSTVAADLSVLTYLVADHTAYWIGHSGSPAPDYVVIDRRGTAWGGNPPASATAYTVDRYGTATYVHYRTIGTIDIAIRTN